MRRFRESPEWWWKSRTTDPQSATFDDLEGVLLGLSAEEWRKLVNPKAAAPVTPHYRDEKGRVVTGNAMVDRLERAAWEEVGVH